MIKVAPLIKVTPVDGNWPKIQKIAIFPDPCPWTLYVAGNQFFLAAPAFAAARLNINRKPGHTQTLVTPHH